MINSNHFSDPPQTNHIDTTGISSNSNNNHYLPLPPSIDTMDSESFVDYLKSSLGKPWPIVAINGEARLSASDQKLLSTQSISKATSNGHNPNNNNNHNNNDQHHQPHRINHLSDHNINADSSEIITSQASPLVVQQNNLHQQSNGVVYTSSNSISSNNSNGDSGGSNSSNTNDSSGADRNSSSSGTSSNTNGVIPTTKPTTKTKSLPAKRNNSKRISLVAASDLSSSLSMANICYPQTTTQLDGLNYPEWDEFCLIVCDICGIIIRPQALEKHLQTKHHIGVQDKTTISKVNETTKEQESIQSIVQAPPFVQQTVRDFKQISTPVIATPQPTTITTTISAPISNLIAPHSTSSTATTTTDDSQPLSSPASANGSLSSSSTTSSSSFSSSSASSASSSYSTSIPHVMMLPLRWSTNALPPSAFSSRYQDRKWRNTYNVLKDAFF